ncbi:DNA polymerase III subunit gamma and tau [Arthrobacter dokdonensis]|uniref:DNA polymerase III subunit gamma and tau n=1 Tax=Arthrobacter dokdonellae TaxID=2211210 RepID=UPI001D1311AE|nr:DNA polymerase III subunit gamma and tau [Arthrobacter dokdonellae]
MSAPTALYRRYRPDSFADVIGQEHVTAPLMAALEKNRVNHAYLFSGPRGCGKTTSARILARCLNCAQGPTSHPCGTCDSCVELARGGSGSLDVIEIDAASHGGVDDARDLRERATFAPIRDRYKIFIIDEAHMVTSAGFNALLKIVEEPPEHIKFIFATTEPDKVIGTIRSRTHHYPFRLVPPEPLMAYLARLCEQESVPVAPGVLSLVIRAGGGSVRDSLSVLDQLMAGAGAAGLDYELAVDLLGYTHASLLDDVVEALAAADAATVFKSVDRVIQTGHDPRRFVEDLLERFRDLIIVQAMPESAHAILRGTPDELIARMQTQAAQLGASELSRAADVTNTAFNEMTGATSPRLHLELLAARLMLPGADSSARGMAARLDAMERRLNYSGAPAGADSGAAGLLAAAPGAPAPSTTTSPAAAPPVASGGGLAAVRAQLAKAKAEAGAQVASRRQDSAPDAPEVRAGRAPAVAAPADPQWPAASDPERTPTWDDLEQPASAAPATQPGESGASASRAAVSGAKSPAVPPSSEHAPAPAPQRPSSPAVPQSAAPAGPAAGGGTGIEVIRRAWPEILSNLSNIRKASWAMVNQNVVPRAFDGETLRIALPTTALIQTFGNSGHADNLRQAIHTTLGITCQLDPITGDAPGSSAEPNPKGPADRLAGSAGQPASGMAPAAPAGTPLSGPAPDDATPAEATPADATRGDATQIDAKQTDATGVGGAVFGHAAAPRPGSSEPAPAAGPGRPSTLTSAVQPRNAAPPPEAQDPAAAHASPSDAGSSHDERVDAAAQASSSSDAPLPARPENRNGPAEPRTRPGVSVSDWEGPIPDEPAWDDEPPFDDWAEPAPQQFRHPTAASDGPRDGGVARPAVPEQPRPAQGPADDQVREPDTAPTGMPPRGTGASEPAPAPAAAAPYRPKVSSISAWTTGWDVPADQASETRPAAPEEKAAPRRSQLLAAQAQQSANPNSQQDSPQDWGVSFGGPSRNTVADPGWGTPASAPDWAQPAPPSADDAPDGASHVSGAPNEASGPAGSDSAGNGPAANGQAASPKPAASGLVPATGAGGTGVAPRREPGRTESGGTASHAAPEAPAPAAREKLSMYQRLSNSPEALAGRTRVQPRPVDAPYVEDVPSPDDVTIEESGVAGQAAVERILGGQLVEERPLNGGAY